jgi:hypothetical protein
MNRLIGELQRLYFLNDRQWHRPPGDHGEPTELRAAGALTPAIVAASLAGEFGVALDLVSPAATTRVMVVRFARSSDWDANLYRAVQDELELPAPALSVSGRDGYRLWFSLAVPVSVAQARCFVATLGHRYLAELPAAQLDFQPAQLTAPAGPPVTTLVPALNATTGKWSAFIDPSMGGMFVAEPGLEMAPNPQRQADLLAGLRSMGDEDFQRALGQLQADEAADESAVPAAPSAELPGDAAAAHGRRTGLALGGHYRDPKSFLLAVMNDPSVGVDQRIKAARALLPYCPGAEAENS